VGVGGNEEWEKARRVEKAGVTGHMFCAVECPPKAPRLEAWSSVW
jgi:hypothetical protein